MTELMLNLFVTVLIRILPVVYRFAWLVYEVQYYMYFVLVYYMWYWPLQLIVSEIVSKTLTI